MEIPSFVERLSETQFRAVGVSVPVSGVGSTKAAAVDALRGDIQQRMTAGTEWFTISVAPPPQDAETAHNTYKTTLAPNHPLAPFAGSIPNDELTQMWLAEMQAYREERESDKEK